MAVMRIKRVNAETLHKVWLYFATHLCATQTECAEALGLHIHTVGRYVYLLRREWKGEDDKRARANKPRTRTGVLRHTYRGNKPRVRKGTAAQRRGSGPTHQSNQKGVDQ